LKPPLRPNQEVVAAIARIVENRRACALLLGVTPELSRIAARTVALDWSETMIANIWPGDGDGRHAVLGDWRAMPFRAPEFSAAIGDGSFNTLEYCDYRALFAQLENVLTPHARIAVRVYATPQDCEPVANVRREALSGGIAGFHAFKWRLAMAIASEARNANVPVAEIRRIFEREFPDRQALGNASGWSTEDIAEIDAYADRKTIYTFPTRDELLAACPRTFANPQFVASGTYELAERCPIFVADFVP
jgi:hypothetical protein